MGNPTNQAPSTGVNPKLSTINVDLVDVAKKAGWKITGVITEPPGAGQTDLFVYQPNPLPGAPQSYSKEGVKKWLGEWEYWSNNYFELPQRFQPISGVSGLIIAARRACSDGRKLRLLRIMGHGSVDFATIGKEQVWLEKLINDQGQLTEMGKELKKLADYLDPKSSIVILDHCLCGQAENFLRFLSELWGGVAVRAYRDYQYWETGSIQIGKGVYTQCVNKQCEYGIEVYQIEKQAKSP